MSTHNVSAAPAWWRGPGTIGTLLLAAILLGFALTVKFPVVALGFQSDEATYYSLGHSFARDFDAQFTREDLVRVWEEFPSGPQGIFLKKGREPRVHWQSAFPFVALDYAPDPRTDRLYFGKSFIYPLAAAPFIVVFGTNGFLVLHALLLSACFAACYAFVRARSEPSTALAFAIVFLFASAAPVYFVWLTPELFNLAMVLLGLFAWAFKEVSSAPASSAWWRRVLYGPWSDVIACALLGIATFSKPLNILAAAPVLLLALSRRQWPRVGAVCLTFVAVTGGLFLANFLSSGDFNYQGGDRSTFYGMFPFQTPESTFERLGQVRATDGVLTEVLFNRDALGTVLPWNVLYFLFGRHTGLVPYFFPGVLTAALFLFAGRAGRGGYQWLVFAALVLASIGLLVYTPFSYSGGGGPVGNRYFLGYYGLFLFLVPAGLSLRAVLAGAAVGGLFTAQLVLNPFYTSFYPATHPKYGLFRLLPIELSLINDLPVNVTPSRVKQPLGGDPPLLAYFMDDNAYDPEGEWFWVRGQSRADVVLRAGVRTHPNGAFTTLAVDTLEIEIANGAVRSVVTIDTGAERVEVSPEPGESETVRVRVRRGFPYKPVPGLPMSRVYSLSITASNGFVPMFTEGGTDHRFLGTRVRITPAYRDDRYERPR